MLLRARCGLEMCYDEETETTGLCMDDCKGQQEMYSKKLHGKVQHSEELRGIHGLKAYQHWVQALLIECGLC